MCIRDRGPVNRPTIDSTIHWQHNVYDDDGNKVGNKDHCYFFADTKITRDGTYLPTDMFDGNYHTIGVLWTKEEYIFYYDGYEMYRTCLLYTSMMCTTALTSLTMYMCISGQIM